MGRQKVVHERQQHRSRISQSSMCVTLAKLAAALPLLILLFSISALPQVSVPGPALALPQPEAAKDSFGRTTPRGTVLGLLSAARKGDYGLAAKYLNTRSQGKAAAELAHQLSQVLDRGLPARLNQISDKPEGSGYDPLKPDQDLIGTISSSRGNVDILVERVEHGKAGLVWLFSPKTLQLIPDLYEEFDEVSVEEVLPDFLVTTRVGGIALFHWLAVFLGLPLFYGTTVLLNRLLKPLIRRLGLRLCRKTELPDMEPLPMPIRLLLLAFLIHWTLSKLSLPLLARQFWSNTAAVIAMAACVWLLIDVNSWGEALFRRRLRSRHMGAATSLVRVFRRVIDTLIVFAGVVVGLHYFGLNPTAALAGLGVGGIAVALAAQKTLENVIGGVSLIFDEAVRVGDFLKLGEFSGSVDYIGLRSTRIRTADRTMVSVPNGQIANMSLEIVSSRDKFSFHVPMGLRYETTADQIRAIATAVRELLTQNSWVDQDSLRVRFVRFGAFSLDLEIFAYIFAREWSHFLEIQEELLFSIMEIVQRSGARMAFPSQTMYLAMDSDKQQVPLIGWAKNGAREKKSQEKVTAKPA